MRFLFSVGLLFVVIFVIEAVSQNTNVLGAPHTINKISLLLIINTYTLDY